MKCPTCQNDMLGLNGPPVCPSCDRKRNAEERLDRTAGSRSSTPETDAVASMRRTHDEWKKHAEKLERERNEKTWLAMEFAGDLAALRNAVRNMRDVKGRRHTQIATERLFALLPENA